MKHACGLHLSSAPLILYSQPPWKQTNISICDVMLLHVKLSDTQDNSAMNISGNTILFRRLKSSEDKIQNFITVTRSLLKSLKLLSAERKLWNKRICTGLGASARICTGLEASARICTGLEASASQIHAGFHFDNRGSSANNVTRHVYGNLSTDHFE